MGRRGRAWIAIASAVLLSLVALFAYAPIFAVDFFWHLKLGQLIALEHAIPRVDLFSAVHPERPYVQFQWLWELSAYGAYALGGLRGVRWFQVATLVASFALLGHAARRTLRHGVLAFCWCAFALVLFEDRFQARPSATVLGFLACIIPWLLDARLRARPRVRAWVLLIACLWSNVHGGESLLMVACFGALFCGTLLAFVRKEASSVALKRDGQLAALSALGVMLSPAFVAGLRDWAHAIGPQLATHNKEWQPSYTMLENGWSPSHLLIALGPTLVALAYVWEQRERRRVHAPPAWGEWLLCAGLLLLAQLTVRNAFLCIVPLACMLRRASLRIPERLLRLIHALGYVLLLVAFVDHVIVGYGGVAQAVETIDDDVAPYTFPVELAQFMREAQIEGGILNDGRWGGYLIWELWPRCHVFVDTRHDLSTEMWPVFMASHEPQTRPRAMETAFARWGVELAVFRGPTFPLVEPSPSWQLLYKAGDQELYQHRQGVHAADNFARARRWLEARSSEAELERDYQGAATRVGASVWLAAPAQRRLHQRALSQLTRPGEHEGGLLIESELAFDAGFYPRAYALLGELVTHEPVATQALYRYALTAYVLDQLDRARWALEQLAPRVGELSRLQLGRLAVLEHTLRRAAQGTPGSDRGPSAPPNTH